MVFADQSEKLVENVQFYVVVDFEVYFELTPVDENALFVYFRSEMVVKDCFEVY